MEMNNKWKNILGENTVHENSQVFIEPDEYGARENFEQREEVSGKLNISINTNKELMKDYMDRKKQEIANEILG